MTRRMLDDSGGRRQGGGERRQGRGCPASLGRSCRRRVAPRDSVGAMGWRRGRVGWGGLAPVGVRVRFGARSRADPIWPPPSGVPGVGALARSLLSTRHSCQVTGRQRNTTEPTGPPSHSVRHSLVPPQPRLYARRYRPPLASSHWPVPGPLTSGRASGARPLHDPTHVCDDRSGRRRADRLGGERPGAHDPRMVMERYYRYVPNLTRQDGKALASHLRCSEERRQCSVIAEQERG